MLKNVLARVVGVVGDHTVPVSTHRRILYLPIVAAAGGDVDETTMTIRTAVELLSLVSTIRSAIAELDLDLPIANIQSMSACLAIR